MNVLLKVKCGYKYTDEFTPLELIRFREKDFDRLVNCEVSRRSVSLLNNLIVSKG